MSKWIKTLLVPQQSKDVGQLGAYQRIQFKVTLHYHVVAALVGFVLVFGMVACSQRGAQEPALSEQETPQSNADSLGQQAPPDTGPAPQGSRNYDDLEIITLLPRDGILAIDNPGFLSAEEADSEYAPDELVIGVNYNGDARAYSIPFLSGREIVNDTVGGKKIAVTW